MRIPTGWTIAISATLLLPALACAAPNAHDKLTRLAEQMTYELVALDPIEGTYLGLSEHDGDLVDPTEKLRAQRISLLKGWNRELEAIEQIEAAQFSLTDRDDARLLRARLSEELNELLVHQWDRKSYTGPAEHLIDAIFEQFLHLPIAGQEGASAADVQKAWDDIVSRLSKGSAYIEAGQKLVTHPGHLYGIVGSEELEGVPDFLNGALTDAAKAQLSWRPDALARFVAGRDALLATIAQTKLYVDAHVAHWPENYAMGKKAYNLMLRDEQLLPYDDIDVERMARDELAHGWAEEVWLMSASSHAGTPFGPATGGGMAPGGALLIDYYQARIADLKKFVADHDLITLPDWLGRMDVVETPAFLQPVSPGASMHSPRLFSKSTTGYYFITPPKSLAEAAKSLDMNQDFDRDRILSTAAHEAMPGHFLQLSIAKRHPDFIRKISDSGVFAEGWAFYGEEMFVRLGLYGDDLDARLFTARWERVRGARAVVDPKLASGEWTVAQAVEFFEAQSGFSHKQAQAAVHGIALRPGYVISYTVGRLQMESLLAEYQQRMGSRASLHDFHDRLLSYGSVPFAIVGPELLADLDKPAASVRAAANY